MRLLKYTLLIILLYSYSHNTFGQNPKNNKTNKINKKGDDQIKTKNFLKKANIKYKQKKYNKALEYAKLAHSYCDKTTSLHLIATIYAKQNKTKLSGNNFEKAFEKAIENGIDKDTILLNWGQLNLEKNQFLEALDKFNNISHIDGNPILLYNRGLAYLQVNLLEEAINDFIKAGSISTNQNIAYNLGVAMYKKNDYAKAKEHFVVSINKGKGDINKYLALAKSCEKLKQYEEALVYFNKAYKVDKKNIEAILGIGYVNNKPRRDSEAKKMFSKALEIEPALYDAILGLGYCELNTNNYEKARFYFEKAINIDPQNPAAHTGKGNVNCHFGKYQEAINDYSISISLKPENPSAYEGMGIAYFRLSQYYNAFESFFKIETIDKNYVLSYDALISKGFTNYNLDKFKDAKIDFEKSIVLEPKKSSGYNGLGCANFKLKDYKKSIQNFSVAVQYSPNDDVILTNRGNALYQVRDYNNAKNDFFKAVSINPLNEHAYNGLGICNHQNNRFEDAIKNIQKAIEISPTNKDLYRNLGISRGHFVKDLRNSKNYLLADQQYLLMLEDHEKASSLGFDHSEKQINLGYLHSVLEMYDISNDYYNSVINHNYYAYVDNNKGVLLALRENGKFINEAYELFENAVKKDDEIIALNENFDKYEAPRINKYIIGKTLGKDFSLDYDNLSFGLGSKEKYINTYFYYALMRYNPPPVEHNFPVEINLKTPEPASPNIDYIVYKGKSPCYKIKEKKVKVKRLVNRRNRKNELLNCPDGF